MSYVKTIFRISTILMASAVFTQCMFMGHPAGQGPVGALYQQTTTPGSGNDLSIPQTRTGEACTNRILLWIIGWTWGEGTISDAANDGGITRISTVDTEQLNVLSIYSRQCTVVKGDDKPVSPGSTSNPGPGFSDTVIMRDGTVHRNVKTIIQWNLINIIKSDGTSLTVPKTSVRTVRKGR